MAMIWRPTYHRRIAQLIDASTTAACFVLAYFFWNKFRSVTGISAPIEIAWDSLWKIIGFSIVWVIIFTRQNAYSYQRFTSLKKEIVIVAKTVFFGVFIFFAAHFLFRFGYIPRSYMVIFGGVNFIALSLEKTILFYATKIIRRKRKNKTKILVVGTGTRAKNFIETIEKHLSWGLEIIGLLTGDPAKVGMDFHGRKVLGSNHDIETILHENRVDEVIICVSTKRFDQIREILEICEREGVQVRLNSDFFGKLAKKVRVDHIYGLPIISFITTPDNEWALAIKRLMDIFISGFLLIVLSPLFLIIALLIKITSRGPVFYQWDVIGLNKKPFRSWKFRTMIPSADQMKVNLEAMNIMKGPVFKMERDPRVTNVGKFLRKYSLDELPQLWSVLKGDMSLVGPRPVFPQELHGYESWHRRKLSVKPGITCLWQISGRHKVNDFDEWVRLDFEYIDNWSLWLDIKILFKTIVAVLKGGGL